MFDHLSLLVSDLPRSLEFYDQVLAPLDVQRCFTMPHLAAYGIQQRPMFWLSDEAVAAVNPPEGFHLAFQAANRQAVDEFYQAAIAQGAIDNGKPGLRPDYHADYYAAFVLDLDGYRIEAVCHALEQTP